MRRTPNFLLGVFGAMLAVCILVVMYGHARYSAAEKTYESHLQHVVIAPHTNVARNLEHYQQASDKWLRIRTAASALAVMASIGILIQVVRRREQRLAAKLDA